MPAWSELAASRAAWAAALAAASAGLGYAVLHPDLLALPAAAAAALAAVALPFEVVLVAALALANGAGAWAPGVTVENSALAGTVLAAALVARSLAAGRASPLQRVVAAGIVAALAIAVVNGVTLDDSGEIGPAVRRALPYGALLLAASSAPAARGERLLGCVAVYATAYSGLYAASAVSGLGLVPGIVRTRPETFAGLAVERIWAPGGILAVYALLYGAVTLASRSPRALPALACGLGAAALLLTMSRTVLVGAVLALLAAAAVLARGSRSRVAAILAAIAVVGGLAYAGIALNPRTAGTIAEVTSESGNFGFRLAAIRQRLDVVADHLPLGVGFAQDANRLPDSGGVTILVRFGAIGAAALGALLLAGLRRSWRLGRAGADARRLGALAAGVVAFAAGTSFAVDTLMTAGGLAVLGAVLGQALAATRTAEPGTR